MHINVTLYRSSTVVITEKQPQGLMMTRAALWLSPSVAPEPRTHQTFLTRQRGSLTAYCHLINTTQTQIYVASTKSRVQSCISGHSRRTGGNAIFL